MAEEMVTVACKAPGGFILNLDSYVHSNDKGDVKRVEGPTTYRVAGWARKFNAPDHTIGGYALTEIPAAFWDVWLENHKDFPPLKDGVLFAIRKRQDAESEARKQAVVPPMFKPAEIGDVRGIEKLSVNE
jgi:hypothetical protein